MLGADDAPILKLDRASDLVIDICLGAVGADDAGTPNPRGQSPGGRCSRNVARHVQRNAFLLCVRQMPQVAVDLAIAHVTE